jgi:hypothetical protein
MAPTDIMMLLVLAMMVSIIAFFIGAARWYVLGRRLLRHLMSSHSDLWRYLVSGGFNLRSWRWFFSEDDNDDPEVLSLKTAIRRCMLFACGTFGVALVVATSVVVYGVATRSR